MKSIKSVDKAVAILDYIANHNGQSTLTDISSALDMAISTLSGFIYTLEQLCLIRKDSATGRYYLGIHTFQLGMACDIQTNLRKIIHPFLLDLSEQIDETIHVAIATGKDELIYIDKAECSRPFRMTSIVGTVEPLLDSAVGAILAYALGILPENSSLQQTIHTFHGASYCKKYEPHMDAYCIAIALSDHQDLTFASMSAVVSSNRLTAETEERILSAMFATAEKIKKAI